VSSDDKGELMLRLQLEQEFNDSLRTLRVEISSWFIGEYQARSVNQRSGYRNALLLATAELRGAVPHSPTQPQAVQ
jgi:hypothetical protein